MNSNHESLHIVQNYVQNIILERTFANIKEKIQLQKINKRVPIFGKQKTRKFIPKIIETSAFNFKIHEKTYFLEDKVPKNPMIDQKKKFRKSHYGAVYKKFSQTLKNYHELQSQTESTRHNVGENIEPQLIKLDIESEKQDEFIARKRRNFQRKQIVQKRLQTMTDSDKLSNIVSSINSSYEKQAISLSHSFTTDYNGDLIKFKSGNKQNKSALKQQTLQQLKQEQSFPTQKSHIKVKIKTFIENISLKPTKMINLGQIKNRNIQQIQRESSNTSLLNVQKGSRAFQRKTSNVHNYLLIMKNFELSPGVTLQSTRQFEEDKQNDDCRDIPTSKLIGRLIKKQVNDIGCDHSSKTTRRETKLKISYRKHPKFAEIQNVYK